MAERSINLRRRTKDQRRKNGLLARLSSFVPRLSSVAAAVVALTLTASPGVSGLALAQSGSAPLFLTPASVSMAQGEVVTLSIKVDARSQPVDTAQVYLDFDPALLQVVDSNGNPAASVTLGPLLRDGGEWKQVLLNEADNAAGRLGVAGGKGLPASGGVDASTEFVLATVHFKALTASAGTQVAFDVEDAISLQRSKVIYGGVEVTGAVSGAILTVVSANVAPTPAPQRGPGGGSSGGAGPVFVATPTPAPTPTIVAPTLVPTATPDAASVSAAIPGAILTPTPALTPELQSATARNPADVATPSPTPPAPAPTLRPAATPALVSTPVATQELPPAQTSLPPERTNSGTTLLLVITGVALVIGLAVLGLLARRWFQKS